MSDALYQRLTKSIRWGWRQPLILTVVELVLEAIERDGEIMVGALLAGEYKLVRADKRDGGGGTAPDKTNA